MTKASTYRDMSIPELEAAVIDSNKQIFDLINEKKRTKKLEKPHLITSMKKDRARLLTVLTEKKNEQH